MYFVNQKIKLTISRKWLDYFLNTNCLVINYEKGLLLEKLILIEYFNKLRINHKLLIVLRLNIIQAVALAKILSLEKDSLTKTYLIELTEKIYYSLNS